MVTKGNESTSYRRGLDRYFDGILMAVLVSSPIVGMRFGLHWFTIVTEIALLLLTLNYFRSGSINWFVVFCLLAAAVLAICFLI